MTTATATQAQTIKITGDYYKDFRAAVNAGLVLETSKIKKETLHGLIEEHNEQVEAAALTFVDPLDEDYTTVTAAVPSTPVQAPEVTTIAVTAQAVTDAVEAPASVADDVELAPPPKARKAKSAASPAPASLAVATGELKAVRPGTKRVDMMRDLLLGITIEDLAAKHHITKANAAGFPALVRRLGYAVQRHENGTYQLVLPDGMVDILLTD